MTLVNVSSGLFTNRCSLSLTDSFFDGNNLVRHRFPTFSFWLITRLMICIMDRMTSLGLKGILWFFHCFRYDSKVWLTRPSSARLIVDQWNENSNCYRNSNILLKDSHAACPIEISDRIKGYAIKRTALLMLSFFLPFVQEYNERNAQGKYKKTSLLEIQNKKGWTRHSPLVIWRQRWRQLTVSTFVLV